MDMSIDFLSVAHACKPHLHSETRPPVAVVRPVAESTAFQGWRMEQVEKPDAIATRLLGRGATFVLDFGVHTVGQLQLAITPEPASDAPTRLKLTFAEVPAEIAEPFDPYDFSPGTLSRSWLQDEIINIDVLPATITLPRRYAFRYVKIDVIDTAPAYKIRFDRIVALSTGSADRKAVAPLPIDTPADLRQIDEVAVRTLANCMHTVFEDGPKRDRRLWLGDLRLQALANYATFNNTQLVKRCLALFAGLKRDDGLVNADMYEHPQPHLGNCLIMDYSALFGATVLDYLQASGDREFALALWPIVLKQLDLLRYVNSEGLFVDPGDWWVFIDWSAPLHKSTAMHGVLLYAMQQTIALAKLLGKDADVVRLPGQLEKMRHAARLYLFDGARGVFVSGPERQLSWASQAWMILGGAADAQQGANALRTVMNLPEAVRPAGPYLYHHVVHAMFECGMRDEAVALIRQYWGAMVHRGATTFWEVFDPANDHLSPYHNHLMNSYCHAWSCTPTWFIRKWLK